MHVSKDFVHCRGIREAIIFFHITAAWSYRIFMHYSRSLMLKNQRGRKFVVENPPALVGAVARALASDQFHMWVAFIVGSRP